MGRFDEATDRMMRATEANWDARTPVHVTSDFYGVGTKDPQSWFADFEWVDLGDLPRRDVLLLQCHLGTETTAFAQRGAHPVGLDFSGEAVSRRIVILICPAKDLQGPVLLDHVAAGSGPGLVLINGTGADAASNWGALIEAASERYTVLAPNLPGAGATAAATHLLDLDELAGQVLATTRAAGLTRFHLVGHSIGAVIATAVAAREPRRGHLAAATRRLGDDRPPRGIHVRAMGAAAARRPGAAGPASDPHRDGSGPVGCAQPRAARRASRRVHRDAR